MNLGQLLAFTWVIAWVLAESFFPGLTHKEKIQAAFIATIAIGYLNNVHGVILKKMRILHGNDNKK